MASQRNGFLGRAEQVYCDCAGDEWGKFETPLIGDFNLLNCLAVIIAADAWGIDRQVIAAALRSFKNVRRRAEIVRGARRDCDRRFCAPSDSGPRDAAWTPQSLTANAA